MLLDSIIVHKRKELAAWKTAVPQARLGEAAARQAPPLDFAAALRQPGVSLIAEVKRASPSRGLLRPQLDPGQLAMTYAQGGAAAISVLTDERFFQGSLSDLAAVKAALRQAGREVPVLRKDFILDAYQVYQARAYGADAILLIAAPSLSSPPPAGGTEGGWELAKLLTLTRELGMEALVEVRCEEELDRVLPLEPAIIGVNNRDLHDFSVDLATTLRLRPHIPRSVILVSESGIHSHADVERLARAGVDAILVGEALVTADDVIGKIRELSAPPLSPPTLGGRKGKP
jgi:indole-3-glycerol phosphate synthase